MASFMKNINLVSQSAALFREQRLKDQGITGWQTRYLLAVYNEEGISQEKLARTLFVNKSNVTRQIGALESAGYVRRVQSEEDRRIYNLYLTEDGKTLVPLIRQINAEWRRLVCEGFGEEEKRQLASLVERLVENASRYMETLSGDGGREGAPKQGEGASGEEK